MIILYMYIYFLKPFFPSSTYKPFKKRYNYYTYCGSGLLRQTLRFHSLTLDQLTNRQQTITISTHAHTHTHTYTLTHTHIHTYIYTHIQTHTYHHTTDPATRPYTLALAKAVCLCSSQSFSLVLLRVPRRARPPTLALASRNAVMLNVANSICSQRSAGPANARPSCAYATEWPLNPPVPGVEP